MQGHYRTRSCPRRNLLTRLLRQMVVKSCLQLTPKTLETRRRAELRALPRETARCVSSKQNYVLLSPLSCRQLRLIKTHLSIIILKLFSSAQEDDEVEFECKFKEEDEASDFELKDKIDFKITTGERGLGVKIGYEQEIETSNMETETETEYEVIFDRIIEYRKAASSADSAEKAYDWDLDDVIQTVTLSDWLSFSAVTDDAVGIVSSFSVSSLDGHVNFNFTVSRADQGERVTANKMKIDFRLVDFPWMHNDTYVALLSTVESTREVDVDYDDDIDEMSPTPASRTARDVIISFEEAQDAVGVIPFGEYTWEQTAEVVETFSNETTSIQRSGIEQVGIPTTISVVATSPTYIENTANSQQWIAFSFVGDAAISASNIYWDPEAGIGYFESASAAGVASSDALDPSTAGVDSSDADPFSSFFFALSGALTCWMYLSAL
jgi:hypothetical protein